LLCPCGNNVCLSRLHKASTTYAVPAEKDYQSDSQSRAADVRRLACIQLSAATHSQEQTDRSSRRVKRPVVSNHVWIKRAVFSQVERTVQAVWLTMKIRHRCDAEPGVMQQPTVCKWVKINILQQHTARYIMREHLQAVSASTSA